MSFCRLSSSDVDHYSLDGVPLSRHDAASLRACATARGLPRDLQDDERLLRVLLAVLLAAGGAERVGSIKGTGEAVSSGILAWCDIREEARGYLLASIRREGSLSAQAADALNMLNRPHVVESFQDLGNRWTKLDESEGRARPRMVRGLEADMGASSAQGASAESEPLPSRPWYRSKMVLAILAVAVFFVLVHVVLLLRVLAKVHQADSNVLLYPVYGLSASALVAVFAIVINKLSGSA
eukprot:CAMPEP_0119366762 /NCGR_PEP_ID=MMETSP1334-20130426/13591_1 /TAXON_ID=127549 /ORGANISM="Calcidiscus leptoporus, Strain RCC1130" /LENGTH=238 /DNA_ID=CAMNT_0007383033 /DNA_START=30 /DNA_END=746 /DNA_ORIENTATION=-